MERHVLCILVLGVSSVRMSDPEQCNCEEKVRACTVISGRNGLPGIPGSNGLPGRDGKEGPQGEKGEQELELLKTHISDLQAELKALQLTASKTQKAILGYIFSNSTRVGGKLFVTNGDDGNYETSKATCNHFGGQVASPRNENENNAALKLSAKMGRRVFLGMNDQETEGIFKHLNGEPMEYSNWAPKEPNGVEEDCIEMYQDGKWNDISCNVARLIMCEF
ncbi:pulmonary surfactant-associated protein D-like isoform X2 [Lacerta agilis]|uniref:pulmonary surfactant-associated protein D-like isoform X2 n=1 Tax=Lacerta agilis TaxID=80427 RepID=UPI001419A2DD|nr:pulmonary surfactant-associated protein D-like isoform X2 [Lacerta agilis]